ncbi:Uncharacterized protein Rs2_02230 [Raphanus sativus]|nr:Uncharacterized protein Rs2_02230 [Raphanus sativus]
MRTKSKGKVHPSPSPPPPSSSSRGEDCLSVLKLLPAVILVLVSALSPEDKQVLAYLITRNKKSPVLDCECFDCYMSYWFRWDSSPNRELIHQIIEAFEDHLENNKSPIASEVTEPVLVVPSDEVKSPEKSTEMLRFPVAAATGHKGLARKVLPDVLGLFNSRFWRLWSPNP